MQKKVECNQMDLLIIVPKNRPSTLKNLTIWAAAQAIRVSVVTSENALQYARNNPPVVCFVFFDLHTKHCLRILGATGGYPILAIGKESEAIFALHNGANAFLTSQSDLNVDLLLAHYVGLRSLNFTSQGAQHRGSIAHNSSSRHGEFLVNNNRRTCSYREKICKMTPIEFSLIVELVKNQGNLVPHRALLIAGWNDSDTDKFKRSLFTTITRMRKKIIDCWPNVNIVSYKSAYELVLN